MMNAKVYATDTMTSRERLLAAYRGDPVDRLPFWAKVTNDTWRSSQPEAVRAWTDVQLMDYIHADGFFRLPQPVRVRRPNATVERKKEADGTEIRVTHTPGGDLTEKWAFDASNRTWHPLEYALKSEADIARMKWVFTGAIVETVEAHIAQGRLLKKEIGERGITQNFAMTSPLMYLVETGIGLANTSLMLADYPEAMQDLIDTMHRERLKHLEIVLGCSVADIIISGENTSTTLISPSQFEAFSYRHLREYGRMVQQAGKLYEMHMCGHLLALLELIDRIPGNSIEAFTAPLLGNTRLADGRTRAPSKTLVGGTNAGVWLKSIREIEAYLSGELAACPNHRHIVLTTAGVAPPACCAEKFRAIGEWLATQPIRN